VFVAFHGFDKGSNVVLLPEFEGTFLAVWVYCRVELCRRRGRRLVELARHAGVELLSALAPDVCGDDVSVCNTVKGCLLAVMSKVLVNCLHYLLKLLQLYDNADTRILVK